MKKYKIIGLTGQSGSGKSTVANFISKLDCCIINADEIVNRLYKPDSACLKAVSAAFGCDVISADGTPDRILLAQRAFSSVKSRELLNSVVHPFVIYESLKIIKKATKSGAELVVLDAPQLFESNTDAICDVIISVTAPLSVRIERICKRDNISTEQAVQRINAQLDEKFFRDNSDYIIENIGDMSYLKNQLKKILTDLR